MRRLLFDGPGLFSLDFFTLGLDGLSMRMKDEDFDAVIATNLSSIFRLSRGVMKGMMKARQGRIVNITSVVGHTGNAGQANYCAAKAGVVNTALA